MKIFAISNYLIHNPLHNNLYYNYINKRKEFNPNNLYHVNKLIAKIGDIVLINNEKVCVVTGSYIKENIFKLRCMSYNGKIYLLPRSEYHYLFNPLFSSNLCYKFKKYNMYYVLLSKHQLHFIEKIRKKKY